MEEEKASAYYDDLTRRGSAAARFKQGLGFSSGAASSTSDPPPRGSALASSSFLSQFVKASESTSEKAENDREKHKSQIESIQNKLRKKDPSSIEPQNKYGERDRDRDRWNDRDRDTERRSREIRSTERRRRRRSRSRSRSYSSEDRDRRRERERRRSRRSRSRSFSDEDRKRRRERRRRRSRSRSRSRSLSPNYERSEKGRGDKETRRGSVKDSNGGVDYSKLIEGYAEMTPAERVKAKMKLQLSETAAKDAKIGSGSGWERFDFNKDAPLDNEDEEDEEIKGAHDDAKLVKHLGQTFRFSNVQARREEEIKAAHDEAMFGAPVCSPSVASEGVEESENEKTQIESNDAAATSLFSDKLLSKKQGSWRDRGPRK